MCVKASEDALLSEPKGSAVANDAKPRAEISSLNLCRGAKEENCKLTDAFIAFSDLKVPRCRSC